MGFDAAAPIYIQIGDRIREEIISGKYPPGEQLKSVREYAVFYEVSPLTMHRAMQYLESQGLIVTKKGVGSFVNPQLNPIAARQMVKEQALRFISRLREMGLSAPEILELIRECLQQDNPPRDRPENEEDMKNG